MDAVAVEALKKVDGFENYSIFCIDINNGESCIFQPDMSGSTGYHRSKVACFSFSTKKTTGFMCVGDTSFFLRFEHGKWRLGLLAEKNFWGYPLPSIAFASNIHVVVIPRMMQLWGKPSDPSVCHGVWLMNQLKHLHSSSCANESFVCSVLAANELYSDELINQYEKLDCDVKKQYDSVAFGTKLLPEASYVENYSSWSVLGAFAYYLNRDFVGEISGMSYPSLRAFVNEVKNAIEPYLFSALEYDASSGSSESASSEVRSSVEPSLARKARKD